MTNNIKWFWKKAIFSLKRGKFHRRLWKQLFQIIGLEIKCLFLTGKTLDELNPPNNTL